MLDDLRKSGPWIALFMLSMVIVITATRTVRHCLLNRHVGIQVGAVQPAPAFWSFCKRDGTVSLRPAVF
jgi:hypothetical protein